MCRRLLCAFLILLILSSTALALRIDIPKRTVHGPYSLGQMEADKPRLVLALSGGGLRGAAHIGVLQVLEEAGIVPDGIAGVSIGALIGGMYAVGYDPDGIMERLEEIEWSGILFDEPERPTLLLARKEEHSRHLLMVRLDRNLSLVVPGAVSPGQRLYSVLLELMLDAPYRPSVSWDELRIPLAILATDLVSGKEVIISSGDLVSGIRASLSTPLLFDPLARDTLQLIDGGISQNIPVKLAGGMNADVVLAVDVTAELYEQADRYEPWQIIDIVTTILEEENEQEALRNADVVVVPNLGGLARVSLEAVDEMVETGRVAMQEQLPQLLQKLKPNPLPGDSSNLHFTRIEIVNRSRSEISSSVLSADGLPLPPQNWVSNGGATPGEIRKYIAGILETAVVEDVYADYDSSRSLLQVMVELNPVLRGVIFSGDRMLPDSVLFSEFADMVGRRLDYGRCQSALEAIMRIYRLEGYPAARIVDLGFDASSGILSMNIDIGRLHSIEFNGLNRVSGSWLSKEVPLKIGSPVTRHGILKGTTNLYATGLFRKVYPVLKFDEETDPPWKLDIFITEQPALPVRLGLAYQGERRVRGFIELVYPSPFYYASRLVMFASVGEHDETYSLTLSADRIVGWPLTYSMSTGFNLRERKRFNKDHEFIAYYKMERLGVQFEVGGQAQRWGLLSLTSRLENHDNGYHTGREQYDIAALGVRLALDTQDRTPFPNSGIRLQAAGESAFNLGPGDDFHRTWGSFEAYVTPLRRHTFGCRFSAATADRTTPDDELFRIGGMDSFPGLHLDEAVGALQFSGGVETRYDLISRFLADTYIGLRYDVIGSWDDPQAQIIRRDWMSSVSVYFAFDTLLGPLKVQWGHLFEAGAAKSQNILFLQTGNNF